MTKHKVEPFYVPSAVPTADKTVDLTGREGSPPTMISPVPQTIKYICAVCGQETIEAGQIQRQKGGDVFSSLERAEDWKEPPK
jgi:hypothetical protein